MSAKDDKARRYLVRHDMLGDTVTVMTDRAADNAACVMALASIRDAHVRAMWAGDWARVETIARGLIDLDDAE